MNNSVNTLLQPNSILQKLPSAIDDANVFLLYFLCILLHFKKHVFKCFFYRCMFFNFKNMQN